MNINPALPHLSQSKEIIDDYDHYVTLMVSSQFPLHLVPEHYRSKGVCLLALTKHSFNWSEVPLDLRHDLQFQKQAVTVNHEVLYAIQSPMPLLVVHACMIIADGMTVSDKIRCCPPLVRFLPLIAVLGVNKEMFMAIGCHGRHRNYRNAAAGKSDSFAAFLLHHPHVLPRLRLNTSSPLMPYTTV